MSVSFWEKQTRCRVANGKFDTQHSRWTTRWLGGLKRWCVRFIQHVVAAIRDRD